MPHVGILTCTGSAAASVAVEQWRGGRMRFLAQDDTESIAVLTMENRREKPRGAPLTERGQEQDAPQPRQERDTA